MAATSVILEPKRGRPSAARASAIDRVILQTARELFLAEGFDPVSMEQVASAVGISKGTLYARHSSKEELFAAVVHDAIAEWSAEGGKRTDPAHDDIGQRLRYYARTLADALMRPDILMFQRVLLSVRHRFPELAKTVSDIGYGHTVEVIAADLAAAGRSDGTRAEDAQGVARMVVAAISGYHLHEMPNGRLSADRLRKYADRTVDLVMAARAAW